MDRPRRQSCRRVRLASYGPRDFARRAAAGLREAEALRTGLRAVFERGFFEADFFAGAFLGEAFLPDAFPEGA